MAARWQQRTVYPWLTTPSNAMFARLLLQDEDVLRWPAYDQVLTHIHQWKRVIVPSTTKSEQK
jgi:hypothetical protein